MATIIKNKSDLDKLYKEIANKMLLKTRDEIYAVIKKSIEEYYSEFKPSVYQRTYEFLSSLIKTEIKQTGNTLICEVKIDEEYLNYNYPYTGKYNLSYPHDIDSRSATGSDIVNWANRRFPNDTHPGGNHGYTVSAGRDDGFWDVSLKELGDIISILKKNLLNQGINVIKG